MAIARPRRHEPYLLENPCRLFAAAVLTQAAHAQTPQAARPYIVVFHDQEPDVGSGSWSSVVCGIDWVTSNATRLNIKVAN